VSSPYYSQANGEAERAVRCTDGEEAAPGCTKFLQSPTELASNTATIVWVESSGIVYGQSHLLRRRNIWFLSGHTSEGFVKLTKCAKIVKNVTMSDVIAIGLVHFLRCLERQLLG